jgi:hypothetical protein
MASVGMGPHRRAGRHHHLIQHWLGAEGMPRRYADYLPSDTPPRHNFTELPRIRSERPAFELHYPHMAARMRHEAHIGGRLVHREDALRLNATVPCGVPEVGLCLCPGVIGVCGHGGCSTEASTLRRAAW